VAAHRRFQAGPRFPAAQEPRHGDRRRARATPGSGRSLPGEGKGEGRSRANGTVPKGREILSDYTRRPVNLKRRTFRGLRDLPDTIFCTYASSKPGRFGTAGNMSSRRVRPAA
jgi:hypothetical protein